MTIQQLRYTVAVADSGSITKTAETLFMAQPNLSNAIKALESEIGVTLFVRTPRGVRPTRDGEEFIMYARRILTQVDQLELQYQAKRYDCIRLSVSVARSSSIAMARAAYLSELSTGYRVHFRETTAFDAIQDVTSESADLGIVKYSRDQEEIYKRLAASKKLVLERFSQQVCRVLMSKDHPVSGAEPLYADALLPYPELLHADFKEPITQKTVALRPEEDPARKTIYIYERGSVALLLSNVPGSYLWTSTTAPEVLTAYDLVERTCADNAPHIYEALDYREETLLHNTAAADFRATLLKRYRC